MKLVKSILALMLSSALVFGFASCSNDDENSSSGNGGGSAIEAVSTTGTVAAATTTDGVKKAVLSASNGTYEFTETNSGLSESIVSRAVVDTTKGGTWIFKEKDSTNAKYSGSYKGDISKFGSEEVKLNLTVEKVLNDGKLTEVASKKEFDLAATTTTFTATVPAVETKKTVVPSSGSPTSDTTPTVELPASVGENPFNGKTFTQTNSDSDKTISWAFTADTASETKSRTINGQIKSEKTVYRYTYDANNNLIFFGFKSYSDDEVAFSSVSEYEALLKEKHGDEISKKPEALKTELERWSQIFSTKETYQYELSANTISLTRYFDGTLPTKVSFWTSDGKISLREGLWIWPPESTGNGDGYHSEVVTYKDGKFFGKLNDLGEIEGTYTTSGKGIKGSGCSVTLIFTKLPSGVTVITTNTPYTLTN